MLTSAQNRVSAGTKEKVCIAIKAAFFILFQQLLVVLSNHFFFKLELCFIMGQEEL